MEVSHNVVPELVVAGATVEGPNRLALVEPTPELWDAFVDGHPQGSLLQQRGWGQLKASSGWRSRQLAVLDATGRIVAGALLLVRSSYGLSVAYTPRGPLFAGDPLADGLLLAGLGRVARRARAVFLRLEPNLVEGDPAADRLHTWLLLKGLRQAQTIQPRSSIHVDLRRDEGAILAACSKGHRADIRRAERGGVTVRVGVAGDLAAFYGIMRATGARAGFGIHDQAYYEAAWQIFQPRSRLLLAELAGQVVAAHLVFADSQMGRYLYSGADAEGLRGGANHLLEWHALRWAHELGCAGYDLWGIPDALGRAATAPDEAARTKLEQEAQADPLIGVYRFKKGFGGAVVRYLPAYDKVLIPPLYGLALRRLGA